MKNKFLPRRDQKHAALYRVLDAIAHLVDLYDVDEQQIRYAPSPLGEDVLRQARRDGLIARSRMLIIFFEMSAHERSTLANGTDTVIAEDYDFEARELDIDEPTRARILAEVAELAYSNLSGGSEWDFAKIAPPLLKRAAEFMSHVEGGVTKGSALSLRWDFYMTMLEKRFNATEVSTRT